MSYNALLENKSMLFSLKKCIGSTTMHTHPLCNSKVKYGIGPSFLKISPCVVCLCEFQHDVVFMCRRLYHPWCVFIHFKHNNKCVNCHYKMDMSLEWFKNFGFKEFYKALLKRNISKGCEES